MYQRWLIYGWFIVFFVSTKKSAHCNPVNQSCDFINHVKCYIQAQHKHLNYILFFFTYNVGMKPSWDRHLISLLHGLQMQLSSSILRWGSFSHKRGSRDGSFHVLEWKYFDWLPFLQRIHGSQCLEGWTLDTAVRNSVVECRLAAELLMNLFIVLTVISVFQY